MKLNHWLLQLLCISVVAYSSALMAKEEAYIPKAIQVTDNVFAIVGPINQRSEANDGLNNNFGVIVTKEGVILIDSGASKLGAVKIAKAVKEITEQPIRWVINTGGQDHRWLGNHHFVQQGAETIALERTAATHAKFADRQLESLKRFLGKRLEGTVAQPATKKLAGNDVELTLGGVKLVLSYTDTHFPGDAWVWLPDQKVIITGDLVYVDRMLSVHPWSSMRNAQKAFKAMEALGPKHIIPGHGKVCDIKTARRDSGDYYDFLVGTVGSAAQEMEAMEEVIDKYSKMPAFEHLEHFNDLHRANMNRTYLEFESY